MMPVFTGAEPQLFVADVARSAAYYRDMLGFAIAFLYGDPPYYGQVMRDAARLNLRCLATPPIDPGLRERETLLSACITLAGAGDIGQLYSDLAAKGVEFRESLRVQPWGAKTFIMRDPDGNLVLFAAPAG